MHEYPTEEEIPQSKLELLECIHNLMGVFDTPVARLKLKNSFCDEARDQAKKILEQNGIHCLGR